MNGGALLGRFDLDKNAMETVLRQNHINPTSDKMYYDSEYGYDGWGFSGLYNGVPYSVYTRWGQPRIGGYDDSLDFDGLVADLQALTKF